MNRILKRVYVFLLIVISIVSFMFFSGCDDLGFPDVFDDDSSSSKNSAFKDNSSSSKNSAFKDNSSSSKEPIFDDCIVVIESCRLEYNRNDPIVIVKYKFTNLDSKPNSFRYSVDDYVFQDGVALDKCYFVSSSIDYLNTSGTEIKPGVTIYVEVAYKLNDTTTDIEVEVYEWISFDDDKKIQKTFSFQ